MACRTSATTTLESPTTTKDVHGTMKTTRLLLLVCAVLLGAAACSTAPDDASPSTDPNAVFADVLAEAEEAGASDEQLATLREAVEKRTVPIEAAREAARRTVVCMQEAGLDAQYDEQQVSHGLAIPGYAVQTGTDGDEDIDAQIAACDDKEYIYVSRAYQLQPSSLESAEKFVEQRAPVIQACLEDNGVKTDPNATGHELAELASQTMRDTGSVNCLAEAGIEAW